MRCSPSRAILSLQPLHQVPGNVLHAPRAAVCEEEAPSHLRATPCPMHAQATRGTASCSNAVLLRSMESWDSFSAVSRRCSAVALSVFHFSAATARKTAACNFIAFQGLYKSSGLGMFRQIWADSGRSVFVLSVPVERVCVVL